MTKAGHTDKQKGHFSADCERFIVSLPSCLSERKPGCLFITPFILIDYGNSGGWHTH